MQKLLLVYYHPENRATSQIWKVLPNMVFPPIWGEKMAAFWACACKLSWTLLSPARVQPLYGAGRKESSGTGLDRRLRNLMTSIYLQLKRKIVKLSTLARWRSLTINIVNECMNSSYLSSRNLLAIFFSRETGTSSLLPVLLLRNETHTKWRTRHRMFNLDLYSWNSSLNQAWPVAFDR